MKKIHIILTMLLCALGAWASDYTFPPELEEIIKMWEETKPAKLPSPKAIRELEDARSTAPARMVLPTNIIVNKRSTRLYVVNVFGDTLASFPVCASMYRGQKQKSDDCRTPEGTFSIVGIYNSTDWRYKGTGAKCYGPFFISVYTPGFYGIGIHGTNAPGSIPGRHSHGCMRMHNEDIVKVRAMVNKDSRIHILPDDPVAEAREIAKLRGQYVPHGTDTGRRVTDDEVNAFKEDGTIPPAKPAEKPAVETPKPETTEPATEPAKTEPATEPAVEPKKEPKTEPKTDPTAEP